MLLLFLLIDFPPRLSSFLINAIFINIIVFLGRQMFNAGSRNVAGFIVARFGGRTIFGGNITRNCTKFSCHHLGALREGAGTAILIDFTHNIFPNNWWRINAVMNFLLNVITHPDHTYIFRGQSNKPLVLIIGGCTCLLYTSDAADE